MNKIMMILMIAIGVSSIAYGQIKKTKSVKNLVKKQPVIFSKTAIIGGQQ